MPEIAVLESNHEAASGHLAKSLAAMRKGWEGEATARNLRLIREARTRRNEPADWIAKIEQALDSAAPANQSHTAIPKV